MSREFPIIKFDHRDQDNARTPGGGNDTKPKFTLSGQELKDKGQSLLMQLNTILEGWEKELVSDIPKVVEIKYIEKAKAKSHQSLIIEIFKNYKNSTQIGATSDNGIIVQMPSINKLSETITEFSDYNENDIVISAIESIQRYEPDVIESTTNQYNLTFWDFMEEEPNSIIINKVEKLLNDNGIINKRDSFGDGEKVIEVSEVTPDKLEFIKKLPIKQIEPNEKIQLPFLAIELESDQREKVLYDPNIQYPVVGLLDSGVEINSYTEGWVTRGNGGFYRENELNKSHGTYIASLLIHGDMMNNVSDFSIAGCQVIEVPIIPACYEIDTKILIRNIESAIKRNPEVKLWNLSVSITSEINDTSFSRFAKELDRIQEENEVLIFKSAGNDRSFYSGGQPGRLHEGADSVRAVTVGSINRNDDQFGITKKGYPSPYSRIGKGPSFIIKPELVHYGGDVFALNNSPSAETHFECVDALGVSVNEERIKQPGTSFSTPKVAKNAAEIKTMLNTSDLLLTKALLVHSANHQPLIDLSEEEITQRMGFGLPKKADQIISEENHHAITLMMNGKLEKGKEIDIMDFPFPSELIEDNEFIGRIVVTLVSNPHFREDLASEYCQTNLNIKFGTYDEKENVEGTRAVFNPIKRKNSQNVLLKNLYSKRLMKSNIDYNFERTLIEYNDKYYPVKKYACDLSEFTEGNKKKYLDSNRKWYIHLKGEYRDYILKERDRAYEKYNKGEIEEFNELSIEYCLLVSIYDPTNQKNVYGSVINELDRLGFYYQELSIDGEVNVDTEI